MAGNKSGRGGRGRTMPGAAPATNGGTAAPTAPVAGGRGRRGKAAGGSIGGGQLVGPGGAQLSAKVKAGTITGAQAKRTLGQRQTLAKALGPNWRAKLTVGGKSFAQVNKQLKANPGNAKLAALRKKLVTNRSTVLDAARAKVKGGGSEGGGEAGAEGGKTEGGKKGKRRGAGQA